MRNIRTTVGTRRMFSLYISTHFVCTILFPNLEMCSFGSYVIRQLTPKTLYILIIVLESIKQHYKWPLLKFEMQKL